MTPATYRFGPFALDTANRRLSKGGADVELNARYFDALALLVDARGGLVTKNRFHDDVWKGVPVTDEALTQCVRSLRRALGDDAARPRFIETVPKHGYRFVAAVEAFEAANAPRAPGNDAQPEMRARRVMTMAAGAIAGGAAGGLIGGLLLGLLASSGASSAGVGSMSTLFVLVAVTLAVALTASAGVGAGIAATAASGPLRPRAILGGAVGGLLVGAMGKSIGLDAFSLLAGTSPGAITGAAEGAIIGAGVGLAAWLGSRRSSIAAAVIIASAVGALCGIIIVLAGGNLLSGSLESVATGVPGAQIRLDTIGALFGETGIGPIARMVSAAVEAGLFSASVVGGMLLAQRRLAAAR